MTLFNIDGTINHLALINWNEQFLEEATWKWLSIHTKIIAINFLAEDLH